MSITVRRKGHDRVSYLQEDFNRGDENQRRKTAWLKPLHGAAKTLADNPVLAAIFVPNKFRRTGQAKHCLLNTYRGILLYRRSMKLEIPDNLFQVHDSKSHVTLFYLLDIAEMH